MMTQHFKENIMRIEISVRTYDDDDRYSSVTNREFSMDVSNLQAQNVKLKGVIEPLVQSCVAEHIGLSNKDE